MDILNAADHRPYPLPSKRWIMRQVWNNVLFLHWPVPPERLRPFIPSALEIDMYERTAWIGIVAFQMKGIYFRGLQSISVVPPFAEMNVRTYVTNNGKPGVFFMTLDVNDWASLNIAKRWYRLPYSPAAITILKSGETFYYKNNRKRSSAEFYGNCTPVPGEYFPEEGTLDHWLTERYCFYTTDNKYNIYCGEIHHLPWPLQKAEITIDRNTLFSQFHLDLSHLQPIANYSKGVESFMWNCKKLQL
ncbi:YqjF family protein [Siminovitchia sediminis]|uniref:YqjF family protein n=1 Tax=Siminovitchia sediminis TaxID=1274353 RepID=A0ABW4KK01_9BACI